MIKYRGLGYTLEDSMATYREFKSLSELKDYIKIKHPECEYVRIIHYDYGPDKRIGWEHSNILMYTVEKEKICYPCGFVCIEGDIYV